MSSSRMRMSAVAISRASSAGLHNGTLATSMPTRGRSGPAPVATTDWNAAAGPVILR